MHDILNPGSGPPSAGAKAGLPNGVHKPSKPAPAPAKGKSGKSAGSNKSANAAAVDPAQQMREQQLAEESQVGSLTIPDMCLAEAEAHSKAMKNHLGASEHVWLQSVSHNAHRMSALAMLS